MKIKGLVDEDIVNYKKTSMFIIFPDCTFKCDKENGSQVCQNSKLTNSPNIDIPISSIINRYKDNKLTSAIVFGGLEPFDSPDIAELLNEIRHSTLDDIVIYTGYTEEELKYMLPLLESIPNLIIKFGRFIPNQLSHYDEILGVELASDNQYAKVIGERIEKESKN